MNNWLKGLFLYGNINKLIGQMVLLSIPVIFFAVLLWSSFLWVRVIVAIIFSLLGLVLFVRFIRWVLRSLGISKTFDRRGAISVRPPFRLWWLVACLSVLVVATAICTFTGVEPISTYVDRFRLGITCEDMQVMNNRLVVVATPTRVTSGVYVVTLYENNIVRSTQKISWSPPEANLKLPKSATFDLSLEEARLYMSAYAKDKDSWWKPMFDVRVHKLVTD